MTKIYQKRVLNKKLPATGRLGGFTLIELLVVVLIIGILAAVALPKYELAVEKSRAAEGISLARSIALANQAYYMANGSWSDDINDLDLEFPGKKIHRVELCQPRVRKQKTFLAAQREITKKAAGILRFAVGEVPNISMPLHIARTIQIKLFAWRMAVLIMQRNKKPVGR